MTKTKHVKLFEELDQEGMLDQPIEEPGKQEPEAEPKIKDADDAAEEEEEKLSPREQSIIDRGLDLPTKEQMAAMWLKAKDRIGFAEDRERIEDPAQKEVLANQRAEALKHGDWTKAPYKALAAALDLKEMTVTRTVTKFKRLIQGLGGSESEVVYPKIISANEEFSKMSDSEVRNLADSAVTFTGMDTKLTKTGIMSKPKIEEARERYLRLLNAVKDLDKVNRLMYSQYKGMGYSLDDINSVMVAITKGTSHHLSSWNSFKRKLGNK